MLLLLAERKLDKRVLGSMRLQPNVRRPLRIESVTRLPKPYDGCRLIEFMRLGIENGISGQMVMAALAKASYEICHATRMDFIVAVGRRTTSAIYRSMLFDDVLDGGTPSLSRMQATCRTASTAFRLSRPIVAGAKGNHSLYDFMARTEHPDIDVDYGRVFRGVRRRAMSGTPTWSPIASRP